MGSAIRSLLFLLAPVIMYADAAFVSLHPLYTPETAVRNPALVDVWTQVRIEFDGEDGYNVIYDRKTFVKFHLVELGGEMIADIVSAPDSDGESMLPAHLIARLRLEDDTLRVDLLSSEKLVQQIVQTGSPRYERLSDEDGDDDLLVLTAATAELRQFVLDCLKQPDAFADSDTITLQRAGPEARAADLNERSREVVRGTAKPEAYAKALQQAEEAVRLVQDDADYWNTLGAALYRAGRYSEALTALMRAEQLRKTANSEDLAFRAMAHQKLGEERDAKAVLGELQKMLFDSRPCVEQENRGLLREAENLIAR